MNKKNIYKDTPAKIPQELFEEIDSNENVLIERIISDGHYSPQNFWYDQEKNEMVFLLKGSAVLEFGNGKEVKLEPGDFVKINAHEKHRVKETSTSEKSIWLAIYY